MPRNRPVAWAPRAKRDLREIWLYYAHIASTAVADKLLREIARASERVGENPLAWRARDEVLPGLRSAFVHPYTLFYRVRDDDVQIVRVLHERRDFPAIFVKDEK